MTPILVALTTIGCLMVLGRERTGGARRLLSDDSSDMTGIEGLREVFPRLPEERRVCRHRFGNLSGAPVYCENEFDCNGCHVHTRLRLAGVERMPDLPCEEQVGEWRFNPFRFYHRGHTWARIEGDALVRVGIDPLVRQVVRPATDVQLPELESSVEQGETAFSIQTACGAKLPFLSPISGEVVAVNEPLRHDPAGVSTGSGCWTMVVRPFELGRELQNLLYGLEALHWFRHESDVLRGLVVHEPGFAADGGELQLGGVSSFAWKQFVRNFLISA